MLQEHQAEIYSNWMKTLFIDHPVSLPGKQMDRQQKCARQDDRKGTCHTWRVKVRQTGGLKMSKFDVQGSLLLQYDLFFLIKGNKKSEWKYINLQSSEF